MLSPGLFGYCIHVCGTNKLMWVHIHIHEKNLRKQNSDMGQNFGILPLVLRTKSGFHMLGKYFTTEICLSVYSSTYLSIHSPISQFKGPDLVLRTRSAMSYTPSPVILLNWPHLSLI